MRTTVSIALLVCLFGAPAHVRAEKGAPRAEVLFKEARAAMAKRDYAKACASFAESQRLEPAAGTLANLADCQEKLGNLATALHHWQEALRALPPRDDRIALAREEIASLEKRVPLLTVRPSAQTPPQAEIRRDGILLAKPALGVPL